MKWFVVVMKVGGEGSEGLGIFGYKYNVGVKGGRDC